MSSLQDLYSNAKDKRKQTLQEIFNTNFEKTLSVVENALKAFKGDKDTLKVDIARVSDFSQEVGLAVETHLKKQNIKCKYFYDDGYDPYGPGSASCYEVHIYFD